MTFLITSKSSISKAKVLRLFLEFGQFSSYFLEFVFRLSISSQNYHPHHTSHTHTTPHIHTHTSPTHRVGDILESVNGINLDNADHREAVRAVRDEEDPQHCKLCFLLRNFLFD